MRARAWCSLSLSDAATPRTAACLRPQDFPGKHTGVASADPVRAVPEAGAGTAHSGLEGPPEPRPRLPSQAGRQPRRVLSSRADRKSVV